MKRVIPNQASNLKFKNVYIQVINIVNLIIFKYRNQYVN